MSQPIGSMSLQNQGIPPAYFRVILNNANKRIFNATRPQKKDKLGPLQNSQEFLALNRLQLQLTLSNMFIGHNVAYFPDVDSSVNLESVGLSIGGLLDAHDNWATQGPVIRSAGFGVEVVGCRHILILHARVQAQHVFSSGVTSGGVSDSSVFNESTLGRNVRAKADIRTVFSSVNGLWPRTNEGLPLPWSEVPCWVKTMCVSAFKTLLDRKKLALTESVEADFSKCASPFSIIVLDMINAFRVGY